METMRNRYNEEIYRHASQRTINHKQLVQTVKTRKTLMHMQRKTQRSKWRFRMRSPTYSQMTTDQQLTCRWCEEDYNSIIDNWILHFPAMEYWRTLMMSKLPDEVHLSDTYKTIAVLKSQDADLYEEMRGPLREFPLPAMSLKYIATETVSHANKQTLFLGLSNLRKWLTPGSTSCRKNRL